MTLLKALMFSITSSGCRFVEINLVETTFCRIRPPPGQYDIRSNTSNTATYMYKIVSKLSIFANRFELNSVLCSFQTHMYGWLRTRTCISNDKTSLYTRHNKLEKGGYCV